MKKMTEEQFEAIPKTKKPKECKLHDVVRVYYLGSHSDYGCTRCGKMSTAIEDFDEDDKN